MIQTETQGPTSRNVVSDKAFKYANDGDDSDFGDMSEGNEYTADLMQSGSYRYEPENFDKDMEQI